MGVTAFADIGNGPADVVALLDDRGAGGDVVEDDLVAQRNGVEGLDEKGFVGFHQPAGKLLTGFYALDDDDSHGVFGFMDQEVRFRHFLLLLYWNVRQAIPGLTPEKLDQLTLPESKRESLFTKLNAFSAEVDRNRARTEG
jgi:hypothetical protein